LARVVGTEAERQGHVREVLKRFSYLKLKKAQKRVAGKWPKTPILTPHGEEGLFRYAPQAFLPVQQPGKAFLSKGKNSTKPPYRR
jgi:hypothetical protein